VRVFLSTNDQMSCRQKYWRSSCDKDPACTWQDDALTAKRHMVFHAFNVLSHASVGFSSRGVCREKTEEELEEARARAAAEAGRKNREALEERKAALEKAQEEHAAALEKAQEEYAASLRNFNRQVAVAHTSTRESLRNLNERRRRSERTYREQRKK
jgi:hypothetical protein